MCVYLWNPKLTGCHENNAYGEDMRNLLGYISAFGNNGESGLRYIYMSLYIKKKRGETLLLCCGSICLCVPFAAWETV